MKTMISEAQNGFSKGSSCLDCIFTIAQITEKRREYQLPTYIDFVNFEKAFIWQRESEQTVGNNDKERDPQYLIRAI